MDPLMRNGWLIAATSAAILHQDSTGIVTFLQLFMLFIIQNDEGGIFVFSHVKIYKTLRTSYLATLMKYNYCPHVLYLAIRFTKYTIKVSVFICCE